MGKILKKEEKRIVYLPEPVNKSSSISTGSNCSWRFATITEEQEQDDKMKEREEKRNGTKNKNSIKMKEIKNRNLQT